MLFLVGFIVGRELQEGSFVFVATKGCLSKVPRILVGL